MTTTSIATADPVINPLDCVEELVLANSWAFERSDENQMVVDVKGHWCDYRMFFSWQEENGGLQFACQFDMRVPTARRSACTQLLVMVNERLWLGHFDVDGNENTPVFRYTLLLRGAGMVSVEQVEDLVEIGLSECERYYPAFQFVIWGGKSAEEAIDAAVLDTVGEA